LSGDAKRIILARRARFLAAALAGAAGVAVTDCKPQPCLDIDDRPADARAQPCLSQPMYTETVPTSTIGPPPPPDASAPSAEPDAGAPTQQDAKDAGKPIPPGPTVCLTPLKHPPPKPG
jgi:hypothetical protein